MVDQERNTVFIRDGEASVSEAGTEGGVPQVRHYVMRAEAGIYAGLLSGEWDADRVQGTTDQLGSNEASSGQEV